MIMVGIADGDHVEMSVGNIVGLAGRVWVDTIVSFQVDEDEGNLAGKLVVLTDVLVVGDRIGRILGVAEGGVVGDTVVVSVGVAGKLTVGELLGNPVGEPDGY